jgi:hypothetical protein
MWWLIAVGVILILVALSLLNQGPRDVTSQVNVLQREYDVFRGVVVSWFRRKQSESRTKLASQLTDETTSASTLASTQNSSQVIALTAEHTLQEAPSRLNEARKQEEVLHQHKTTLLNEATQRRVSSLALDQVRIEEEKARTEIEKHAGMKEIDKEVYQFEKEIDVKGAIIARVAPVYEVNLLTDQLHKALSDREVLFLEPDSERKRKMLKRLNKNIKMLNEAIDAKGQGLIQGNSRPELGTGDED